MFSILIPCCVGQTMDTLFSNLLMILAVYAISVDYVDSYAGDIAVSQGALLYPSFGLIDEFQVSLIYLVTILAQSKHHRHEEHHHHKRNKHHNSDHAGGEVEKAISKHGSHRGRGHHDHERHHGKHAGSHHTPSFCSTHRCLVGQKASFLNESSSFPMPLSFLTADIPDFLGSKSVLYNPAGWFICSCIMSYICVVVHKDQKNDQPVSIEHADATKDGKSKAIVDDAADGKSPTKMEEESESETKKNTQPNKDASEMDEENDEYDDEYDDYNYDDFEDDTHAPQHDVNDEKSQNARGKHSDDYLKPSIKEAVDVSKAGLPEGDSKETGSPEDSKDNDVAVSAAVEATPNPSDLSSSSSAAVVEPKEDGASSMDKEDSNLSTPETLKINEQVSVENVTPVNNVDKTVSGPDALNEPLPVVESEAKVEAIKPVEPKYTEGNGNIEASKDNIKETTLEDPKEVAKSEASAELGESKSAGISEDAVENDEDSAADDEEDEEMLDEDGSHNIKKDDEAIKDATTAPIKNAAESNHAVDATTESASKEDDVETSTNSQVSDHQSTKTEPSSINVESTDNSTSKSKSDSSSSAAMQEKEGTKGTEKDGLKESEGKQDQNTDEKSSQNDRKVEETTSTPPSASIKEAEPIATPTVDGKAVAVVTAKPLVDESAVPACALGDSDAGAAEAYDEQGEVQGKKSTNTESTETDDNAAREKTENDAAENQEDAEHDDEDEEDDELYDE
ncbi:hypothetical protein X943_001373 [Babesia divergens]|uniref:Uncharacterized protein n=1 Tax=Babesia divergens TaxID=32595 RepID=A0AAD9GCY1_BABDI|nr:hypothetical protein X943_001373 [Babesia divergens]